MTAPEEAQRYGSFISTYSGQGHFHYHDGRDSASIPFWAGQCSGGRVVLACQEIHLDLNAGTGLDSFVGETDTGLQFATGGRLRIESNGLRWTSQQGISLRTLVLPSLIVVDSHPLPADLANVSYGLVNFTFWGTEGYAWDESQGVLSIPLELHASDCVCKAWLVRRPDYSTQESNLRAVHGAVPTAELRLRLSPSLPLAAADDLASDLCRVLSIAKGTRVQWVYRHLADENQRVFSTQHVGRIAANYSVSQVIGSTADDGTVMQRFIETAFPAYITKRPSYGLDLGILDAYLDAKADSDFLNMKALKLVITMEMLAHAHLRATSAEEFDMILSPDELRACRATLKTAVKEALRSHRVDASRANRIAGRVTELSRRPFEEILERLFSGVGLEISREDRKVFASCRNSLAHDGQFWSSKVPPGDNCPFVHGWEGNKKEYFFLESLLDRVILRLLEYDGPYLDWRLSSDDSASCHCPVRRPSVNN